MPNYKAYFRVAGVLAVLYGALLVAAYLVRAAGLGFAVYDAATPTATKLAEVYANPYAAAASRLETLAAALLVPALPAFGLFLARRTPGFAWGGLALGFFALVVATVGYLIEGAAYYLSAPAGTRTLLAAVPPGDVVLLINTLAEAITMPAMVLFYPWFIIWGLAFARAGTAAGKAAAACFFATLLFALLTFVGFGARLAAVANAGVLLQTFAEAAAWAAAGAGVMRGPAFRSA